MPVDKKQAKKQRTGLPLFDPATEAEIVRRALSGERHVDLGKEYNCKPEYVGRYVRNARKRQAAPVASTDARHPNQLPAGGQYRRVAQDTQDRIRQLEDEIRQRYEEIGRLHLLDKGRS